MDKKGAPYGAGRHPDKRYLAAAGFFLLALLSKAMAITLPAVLLLLDWYPFRRISSMRTLGAAVLEKLPFFVLGLGAAVSAVLANSSADLGMAAVPLETRLLEAIKAIVVYLGKMALPLDLVPYYP